MSWPPARVARCEAHVYRKERRGHAENSGVENVVFEVLGPKKTVFASIT
jgi:hypothetical protein